MGHLYHPAGFCLSYHCGRWGGKSIRTRGVDNYKGTVFQTQLDCCTYKLRVVVTVFTRPVQDQDKAHPSMERTVGWKVPPTAISNYWWEERAFFFFLKKNVAPGKLRMLQWKDLYSRIFGQHILVLMGFFLKRTQSWVGSEGDGSWESWVVRWMWSKI